MSNRYSTRFTLVVAMTCSLAAGACSGTDSDDAVDAGASNADASPVGGVPTDPTALFSFLVDEGYTSFPAEPAVHASVGPHGQVRSFFNQALADSLTAENTSHPVGAATVKELYSNATLSGWAVMVKTANAGAASDWYYYEVLSTTDGSSPVADGQGVSGCAGCHGDGADYILTSFP